MDNQVIDDNFIVGDKPNYKLAGFGIRFGASLIDFCAMIPLVGISIYNTYFLKNLPLALVIGILLMCYKPFMEFQYGATLGKMAVKLKVVNLDFEKITLSQSITRYIPWLGGSLLSLATTYLLFQNPEFKETTDFMAIALIQGELMPQWINYAVNSITLISALVIIFNKNKQGLHDMLADTYCVYKEQTDIF
ncbi:MAG TPA: RDD family protein [Saprospiraceae bacterium]|nr:RDD family protein [Saprospiraceae bacterium]